MGRQIITSESVSEGHPDKVCDRISDAILDAYLSADDSARIACETVASTDFVLLAGEIKSAAHIANDRLETIVREAVREIGYEQKGFHWRTFAFENRLHEQSPDIAMGVDNHGAGDQGIMFGYACDETPEYMPAAFVYATRIVRTLADLRKSGERPDFGPDAKSQISLVYEDGRPTAAHSIVVSSQHAESLSPEAAREQIMPVIRQCLPDGWISPNTRIHINPTGRFVIGGPDGDAGLTGRKIIVDTYGGAAPHGGGAFSGKDPSKVDRSAAYACRYMAKNIVAAGLAKKCTIQTSYAIGIAEPQSLWIDTHGSQTIDPEKLENTIPDMIDLTPSGIRQALGLNRPIYARTAAYGHFGREPEADGGFSWEKTDLVDALRALA